MRIAPPDDTEIVYDASLWANVARLTERAPRESDLRFHGLELLAGRRDRGLGRTPALHVIAAERTAAATSLIAPLVLRRALGAIDGPVVLMKGLEVAEHYENPLTRPYRDIDLLVEDAESAWSEMVEAGFEPTGDPKLYIGIHHLRPLVAPGLPLVVEVHHQPKWLEGTLPPTAELLRTAVPSATGIPGLLTLEPARHAVVLAVHAWAHVPLSRLGRLIDVAAMLQGVDRRETAAISRAWDVERPWRVTQASIDSLLGQQHRPLAGHIWARHLWSVRERTVLERHLERWLGPFSMLPPAKAARLTGRNLSHQFALEGGETRLQMIRRSVRAIADAFKRQSDHDSATEASQRKESS
ncbi:MAG: putative nucleotidyltransferase [Gaiellaceae bacterium]|nr:putative nucleotidyltransferase [Gaiellaceae bacterium]